MKLSYVIVTHNRRDALLKTLAQVHRVTPLPRDQWEAWVVDNASEDGTVDAVRQQYPSVRLIERGVNEGVAARSHAFAPASGQYLILLDDDSYPVEGTVERSLNYLDAHPMTAALVGRVILPDGSFEGCALPAVMLSGAVCIRKSVLDRVGPFRAEFFRKAGEYDLSYRIWQAGFAVERFEDIVYRHDKVLTGRSSSLAHFMDLRNNLILIERFLPPVMRRVYRLDTLRRYAAIARGAGCGESVSNAIHEARQWAERERIGGRATLSGDVLETLFEWRKQQGEVAAWAAASGAKRIVIADYSKNIYATWRAARLAGLTITAIADDGAAFAGQRYRGIPILPVAQAIDAGTEGVIVSNINPAQIDRCIDRVRSRFTGPLLRLWHPRMIQNLTQAARSA